jgi:hypothetical protein
MTVEIPIAPPAQRTSHFDEERSPVLCVGFNPAALK